MKNPTLNPDNQLEAVLALTLIPKLGIQRIRVLLQAVDHPVEIFALSAAKLKAIDRIGPTLSDAIHSFNNWSAVKKVLDKTRRSGAELISFQDENYPPLLREIYDPPILLWIKGNTAVLDTPGIAVVGTRRATQYGLDMATKMSRQLAQEGITTVSGLAFGVDAAAHKATVEGGGLTVAVLGSGIDTIYPQKNAGLAGQIIESGGAVITEFPPGTPPDAGNFPVRNRIVSGLSMGTLVVESGLKGGSMITAQSALTQNREVFVVPHSLQNINGVGCNHLIKRAAGKLVQTVDDILEELPHHQFVEDKKLKEDSDSNEMRWESKKLDEQSKAICKLLAGETMHIDDLCEQLERPSHQVLAKLLELEMMDCVRQTAGKNFRLV